MFFISYNCFDASESDTVNYQFMQPAGVTEIPDFLVIRFSHFICRLQGNTDAYLFTDNQMRHFIPQPQSAGITQLMCLCICVCGELRKKTVWAVRLFSILLFHNFHHYPPQLQQAHPRTLSIWNKKCVNQTKIERTRFFFSSAPTFDLAGMAAQHQEAYIYYLSSYSFLC